ncbi:MAG: hypothetical protein ACRDPY_07845 [Streptosporangiaceae bacterium]
MRSNAKITAEAVRAAAILCLDLYPYICAECGQLPEWNGKPLVLQVDHVNGDPHRQSA